MSWDAYNVFWNALVPQGYILIFPTTETGFSPSHSNFGQDIAFLVGAMKAEGRDSSSPFFAAVAPTSAVMGHSMGGGAAFLAVQYDSSITALATVAAAVTNPSSTLAAVDINIPALVFAGGNDCVTPPSQHQIPMYDSLASACKSFVSLTGGSHCQFAGTNFNCNFGEATCTPRPAISASVQRTITFDLLLPWLDFQLKSDAAQGQNFQDYLAAETGVSFEQNCSLIATNIGENSAQNSANISVSTSPNPFQSQVNLQFSRPLVEASARLFNSSGQAVMQLHQLNQSQITIERGQLPAGLYFLQILEAEQLISSQKLIIID